MWRLPWWGWKMDDLRGFEPLRSDLVPDMPDYALFDDEDAAIEPPPVILGDERRMQVRACNFWTSQLHAKIIQALRISILLPWKNSATIACFLTSRQT